MSRALPPELRRTRVLSLRVHPSEADQLRAMAIGRGLSLADFLRVQCLQLPAVPIPISPLVPSVVLRLVTELHDQASTTYQRAYSWRAWIESERHKRLSKEQGYRILEDLGLRLEGELALVQRVLLTAQQYQQTAR